MSILIITDAYPPEVRSAAQLMADLAEGLCRRGHEVIVATTTPGYNLPTGMRAENIPKDEVRNNVRIARISTLPHHRVNYIFRGFSQVFLPLTFTRAVRKIIERPIEAIIVHSPPLSLALAASSLAKHYQAGFIANVHDIFPQNAIDLVAWWQKPLAWLAFSWMERIVYRRADVIVMPSEKHTRYLEEKHSASKEKLRVIPHWIKTSLFERDYAPGKFRKKWGLENSFVFFFGGVLGPSQGLEMALEAAESFQDNSEVKFLFVGDGGARPRLERLARAKKLNNVVFKPFVSSEEYPQLVREMDAGIVTLSSRNTTPAVPAKLMGYMAAGIPVVLAVHRESDAIRIVNESKCGFTAVSDSRESVINAFRAAYNARSSLKSFGEKGKNYLKENFEENKLVEEWDKILREIRKHS